MTASGFGAVGRSRRARSRSAWRVSTAAVVVLAALVGALRIQALEESTGRFGAAPASGAAQTGRQMVSGTVHLVERPQSGAFGSSATVELAEGGASGTRLLARFPPEAGLPADAAPGIELRVAGRYERPRPEPGEFDFAAHLERRGVAGELAVSHVALTGRRRGGAQGVLDRVRERALAGIAADLPPTRGALAQGMVLGADEGVPGSVRDDFRDAGLAHVLAASGQNVMLLVALAIPLLAAAGLSHRVRLPILVALIALYVPLAGAGPSIQRAGVMGVAVLLATLLSRPASRRYALFLAACATLAHNPRVWQEPGWQLSFAAVAGILLLAPGIGRRLGALPRPLTSAVALTVAATLATAPLLAHHFGTVSLASLPANVVALPLVAPIMWLGTLRGLLAQVVPAARGGSEPGAPGQGPGAGLAGALSGVLGRLLEPLLAGFERVAALFADMPGATLALSPNGARDLILAYALLAGAVVVARHLSNRLDARTSAAVAHLRRLPRGRKLAFATAATMLLALAFAHGLSPTGSPAKLTVAFLDVGQGDATLVQHPDGSSVLFDGGPPEAGVARLLRRAGVRRLSALVMTHASRDHHGGLAEVVERFPIDLLLDGGDATRDRDFRAVLAAAEARGVRRVPAVAPLTLHAGSLRVEVLSPFPRAPGPPPEDPNPRAVVATVGSDGFELLLSGDAESEALLPLPLPDVDAFKVPHHGSADRGLAEVLDRIRPELASIPVGDNSYGHPAPSTLTALRRARIPTWRTDRHGTIRVSIDHRTQIATPQHGKTVYLER